MPHSNLKAGAITTLTDARYFSAWEVHWLGFDFRTGGDRPLTPTAAKTIAEWISGPRLVGEFGLESLDTLQEVGAQVGLQSLQLSPFTPLDTLQALRPDYELLLEVVVEPLSKSTSIAATFDQIAPWVDYFLLNFTTNGLTWAHLEQGQPFSGEQLQQWCQQYPLILSIDLPVAALPALVAKWQPAGWQVLGGDEEKVGLRSFDELDELLEAWSEL